MAPWNWLTSPSWLMSTNSGMMIDWSGIIMPDRTSSRTTLEPRKPSLAKAKPPVVLTTTMRATAPAVTMVELTSCWTTGIASNSTTQLSSEKPDPAMYWSKERKAVMPMKTNGKSITTTTKQRIRNIAPRVTSRRGSVMAVSPADS